MVNSVFSLVWAIAIIGKMFELGVAATWSWLFVLLGIPAIMLAAIVIVTLIAALILIIASKK